MAPGRRSAAATPKSVRKSVSSASKSSNRKKKSTGPATARHQASKATPKSQKKTSKETPVHKPRKTLANQAPRSGHKSAASASSKRKRIIESPEAGDDDDDDVFVVDDEEVEIPVARMYTVPENTIKKWVPISAAVKKLFSDMMANVTRSILGGYTGRDTRGEAEATLLELQKRILAELNSAKGPSSKIRRKVAFEDLANTTRKQEEALMVNHGQIRQLESEVAEQKKLLLSEQVYLDKYMESLKLIATHSKKEHRHKLHPALKGAKFLDDNSFILETTMPTSVSVQDIGELDTDIAKVVASVTEKLLSMEDRVRHAQRWLSAIHRVGKLANAQNE